MRFGHLIAFAAVSMLLASCGKDDDNYVYPSVFNEFTEVTTDGNKLASKLTDDKGMSYEIANKFGYQDFKADTTYRAACMFTRNDDKTVTVYNYSAILTPTPRKADKFKDGVKTDNVSVQSIWRGGSYVNIVLQVMAKDQTHYLHFVEDSLTSKNGRNCLYITLYHDRNKDVEAFSKTVYMSVPLKDYINSNKLRSGDSIFFSANIYSKGTTTWGVAF